MQKIIEFFQKIGLLRINSGDYYTGEFSSKVKKNKNEEKVTPNQSNKNKDKKKSSLPLIFWIIIYLLLAISFFLSIFSSFTAVIIILIIWLFFIFILKRFSFSLPVAIVSLVLVFSFSFFYLIFFTNNHQDNQQKKTVSQKNLPQLEMVVIKSPAVINCDKEKSILEVKAKNVGKKALTFNEFQNHQYDFEICDGDKEHKNGGRSCFSALGGYLKVNDFGIIKEGESKIIQLVTPTATKPDNAIASFLDKTKINGKYKYYISFVKMESAKKKPLISQSNLFTVQTNIMNATNEYIKTDCYKTN